MDIEFIKTAALTLFVAVDPPGIAAIFVALTTTMTPEQRRWTANRSVIVAYGVLIAAAIGGGVLLGALGISLPAFRIAGGLLLFWIGYEMLFDRRQTRKAQTAENAMNDDQHHHTIAISPLAIPMMAGPGAITATILQSSKADGWAELIAIIIILGCVMLSCLAVFRLANPIDRAMGKTGRIVLTRLLGLLLAAMAVQTVGDGIYAFMATK